MHFLCDNADDTRVYGGERHTMVGPCGIITQLRHSIRRPGMEHLCIGFVLQSQD